MENRVGQRQVGQLVTRRFVDICEYVAVHRLNCLWKVVVIVSLELLVKCQVLLLRIGSLEHFLL